MNPKESKELVAQYTEALTDYHEIEFKYNNHEYSLERESEEQYVIWQFEPGANTGTKIAAVKTPEEIFELKCFDGKTIIEIDDSVTDAIVF
jgi:hypothetical protein